ncbi:MAG: hypothetical protein ACUVWB_12490, partial [Anaerolineae bacterium]
MPSTVLKWVRRRTCRRDFAQVPEDWLTTLRRAQEGDPSAARRMLTAYLSQHPASALGWFWLACVTDNPWEVLSALRKVAELGFGSMPAVRQGMAWAQERIARGERSVPMGGPFVPARFSHPTADRRYHPVIPAPFSSARWPVIAGLVVILLAVVLGFGWVLAGNASFLAGGPSAGVDGLVSQRRIIGTGGAVSPAEHALARAAEHERRAEALLQRGDFRQALAELDAAVSMRPYDMYLQEAHALAAQYWAG